MLEYIRQEANLTHTENGAVTHASSGSACLDLFACIGALRGAREEEIIRRFVRAYAENSDLAMKLLFFARDVRGGLGERRVFRVILRWLAANHPASVAKNAAYIADFGRYDDLLALLDTPCEANAIDLIRCQLAEDTAALRANGTVSLLGKWLPSVNTSAPSAVRQGKKVARALGLSDAAYRKTLTALRARIRIIENNLREKDYTFDYAKQPSRAMFKYREAFWRNDGERYRAFLQTVEDGSQTLHAGGVAPYELVAPFLTTNWTVQHTGFMRPITPEEKATLNATWNALPAFGSAENALAVVDTSGSMYWNGGLPAAVALSLGLYFAEHNTGAFRNCFIEFSDAPQLIELQGQTFADRLQYAATFNQVANTDLEKVFDLILQAAVKRRVPQADLPTKLVILSDMEFDRCVKRADATIFENARQAYAAQGYQLPQIVFWNVASRRQQLPVTQNEQGVALVSGVTARLFAMVAGGIVSPLAFMTEVLSGSRYAAIAA